jgi:hypothetical protein
MKLALLIFSLLIGMAGWIILVSVNPWIALGAFLIVWSENIGNRILRESKDKNL